MRDEHGADLILIVSDEQRPLAQFVQSLREEYSVVLAQTRVETELRLPGAAVVLTDEHVLKRLGSDLLENAFAIQPETLWILLTDTFHAPTFAPAIARGQIYYYLKTPQEPEELRILVKRAIAYYHLTDTHKKLEAHCLTLQEQNRAFQDNAPKQVIYADKMVMLGQMVAGIAHEMNTPAGAINAAIGNIIQHLKAFLESLGELEQQSISRADFAQLLQIIVSIAAALDENHRKSSGEVRLEQKRIAELLHEQGIQHSRKLAKQIAHMDIATKTDELVGLVQKYDLDSILTVLMFWSRLVNSVKDLKVSIDVLIRIVQALKSYSYPKQENPELADIHESLHIALTILNNKLKHRIQVTYRPADLPKIWCYASELSHVWLNLIYNAIQAIHGEGEIRIETFCTETELGVRIMDNGSGIPADIQDRIFEIDFTTKRQGEGSGLGLYIARQIIKKHGGTIAVASHPGQTTFEVYLPLVLKPS